MEPRADGGEKRARWLVLGACGLAFAAGARADTVETVGSEPSWHTAAQRCFPATIGEWSLIASQPYENALGEDRSVAYGRGDALASVYVYPQYATKLHGVAAARYELRQVKAQVADVTWRQRARMVVPDTIGAGFVAVGDQPFRGAFDPPTHTLAGVWASDPWFVELRLTWTDLEAPWRPMLAEVMAAAARPCVTPTGPAPTLEFETHVTMTLPDRKTTTTRTVKRVE